MDPYTTFDFKFTNENISSVAIDQSTAADFLPATLTLLGPDEFTVFINGADPAYLDTLVIDVTTGSVGAVPEPSTSMPNARTQPRVEWQSAPVE